MENNPELCHRVCPTLTGKGPTMGKYRKAYKQDFKQKQLSLYKTNNMTRWKVYILIYLYYRIDY